MTAGTPIRCLVVDDDPGIRQLLLDYLQQHGMLVQAVADGRSLRSRLAPGTAPAALPDLLILDLMLPDDDGLNLCRWTKAAHPGLPVILLTAQGDPTSRVLGLELGADDYLPKPFEPRELVARIRAVLRRGQPAQALRAETLPGGWRFDRLHRQLHRGDGAVLALSAAEFRLLDALVAHAGRVLSRERLLALTCSPGQPVNERSVDLAISRLRGKLEAGDTLRISTVRGQGYRLDLHGGPAR